MNTTVILNKNTGEIFIETDDPYSSFNVRLVEGDHEVFTKPDNVYIHEPVEYLTQQEN